MSFKQEAYKPHLQRFCCAIHLESFTVNLAPIPTLNNSNHFSLYGLFITSHLGVSRNSGHHRLSWGSRIGRTQVLIAS